jgi:hypothetical protein
MIHMSSLIALALSLTAAVATIGIGAFLLRNAVKDASDLASELPTRLIREDTSEVREANRRKALSEMLWLLTIRSAPGGILVIVGAGLLIWVCCKLLAIFRV